MPSEEDILEAFASRAFLLLQNEEGIRALMGWRVENLVARVDEIVLAAEEDQSEMLSFLTEEVEQASSELQCEVLLIILPANAVFDPVFTLLGFEKRNPNSLNVPAWKEAALESFEDNQALQFFGNPRQFVVQCNLRCDLRCYVVKPLEPTEVAVRPHYR